MMDETVKLRSVWRLANILYLWNHICFQSVGQFKPGISFMGLFLF